MRKYLLIVPFFTIFLTPAFAQHFFAYSDTLGILYVYDEGYIRRMDERKVQNFKFGTEATAFVDRMDEFYVSFATGTQQLANVIPTSYQFSRGMLTYTMSNNIYAYWNKKVTQLSFFSTQHSTHDSIVCFTDRTGAFKIFYDGTIYNVNLVAVRDYQAVRNIAAYNTHNFMFKVFLRGKVRTLEKYEVTDYKVGLNTVGYLDQTGRLKVYQNSKVTDVEELTPQFYSVADNLVLYHTRNNDFKVFYNDSAYLLEPYMPYQYWIQDQLVFYLDRNNRVKVFDRGNVFYVENFLPNGIKVFDNTLVYLNIYNHLMMYKDGVVKNISNETVNDYWLNGDLIVYTAQTNDVVFVGKGNPYRLKMNWQKF